MNKNSYSSASVYPSSITFGAENADRRLRQGLARGAVHEIYADEENGAAATGFAFLLALRAVGDKAIIVVREDRCLNALGRLYGDGVVDLGGDPTKIIVVHTPTLTAMLRAAADAAGCPNLGSVIIEPWGAAPGFDLTASRRLALRAEGSGVVTLVVRIGINPTPSAAITRWQVRSASSLAMTGRLAFEINLLRHRGGLSGFAARVEWDRDQRSFCDAPLPCAVPAVAVGRAGDSRARRAA